MDDVGTVRRYRVWEVWVDTRNTRGEVVQYKDSHFQSIKNAKIRKSRINARPDRYPNTVAWLEGPHESTYVVTNRDYLTNSQARLNPQDVEEIRARRAQGESIRTLAVEFLVHRKTISKIVNGHSWNE